MPVRKMKKKQQLEMNLLEEKKPQVWLDKLQSNEMVVDVENVEFETVLPKI